MGICVTFDVWTTGTGRLLVDDGMRAPAMKGTLMVEREAIKRNFDSRVEARVANADAAALIMKLTDVLPLALTLVIALYFPSLCDPGGGAPPTSTTVV